MRDDDTDDTLYVTCAYCLEDFSPANLSDRDAVRLTCEGVCPDCNRADDEAEMATRHRTEH